MGVHQFTDLEGLHGATIVLVGFGGKKRKVTSATRARSSACQPVRDSMTGVILYHSCTSQAVPFNRFAESRCSSFLFDCPPSFDLGQNERLGGKPMTKRWRPSRLFPSASSFDPRCLRVGVVTRSALNRACPPVRLSCASTKCGVVGPSKVSIIVVSMLLLHCP